MTFSATGGARAPAHVERSTGGVGVAAVRAVVQDALEVRLGLLDDALLANVARAADLLVTSLHAGGKVLLFGNGGSAADASHLAAELVGRFRLERTALPAVSLTDNGAALTSIANDIGYEAVFERQLRGLGAAGDVAVGLSTSGTSPNVVRALAAAGELGLQRVSFTGRDAGALAEVSDVCLRMPTRDTPRVQECYLLLGHVMCELVEAALCAPVPAVR